MGKGVGKVVMAFEVAKAVAVVLGVGKGCCFRRIIL